MAKTVSRICKFIIAAAFIIVVGGEYLTGEISSKNILFFIIGVIILFVIIPGMFWIARTEPHLVRFRRYLEDGFYKTPAGKVSIVALTITALYLMLWAPGW
jgi:hypothetical protein